MKKLSRSLLPALLCLALLCACGGKAPAPSPSSVPEPSPSVEPSPSAEPTLPISGPLFLYFSSGVGAWDTELVLEPDGTFIGSYHDTDMGTTGEGYPNGTMYINRFEGRFTCIRQLDEYSYALTLAELTSDYEEGKSRIEDGICYVSSVPYGLEKGSEFVFYLPDTPTAGLNEDFLSWWPSRYSDPVPETLRLSALYNVETGYGFFG